MKTCINSAAAFVCFGINVENCSFLLIPVNLFRGMLLIVSRVNKSPMLTPRPSEGAPPNLLISFDAKGSYSLVYIAKNYNFIIVISL